jgi:type II secretion system (T2SS) protein E
MAARIKLGELLVRAGVLDDFKLKAALAEQQRWGGRLGKILVEMNFLSEDMLVRALSKQLGVPRARLDGPNTLPPDVIAKIDASFCASNAICPERYIADKKTLVIAMADPTNVSAIDELRFKTGLRIETALAGELEINQALDRVMYGREPIDGIELSSGSTPAGSASSSASMNPAVSSLPTGQLFDEFPFNGKINGSSGSGRGAPPPLPGGPQFAPTPFPGTYSQVQAYPTPYPSQITGAVPQPTLPPQGSLPPMPPATLSSGPTQPPPANTAVREASFGQRSTALEMAVALDAAQKKQLKALRVMLELLIEKGVISRDEYIQLVNKR